MGLLELHLMGLPGPPLVGLSESPLVELSELPLVGLPESPLMGLPIIILLRCLKSLLGLHKAPLLIHRSGQNLRSALCLGVSPVL